VTFYEITREGPEWGCPRLSVHGAGWLIDWFNAAGIHTGANRATREALAWITSNPAEVLAMQAQCLAWFNAELDAVIPF
jgi:hypothetical protein